MSRKNNFSLEQKSIRHSMYGYLLMAMLGIGFSLYTQSEAIMLYGVYSLVLFVMAAVAGHVSQTVTMPSSDSFPFGFAHFEPALNAVRGLVFLSICVFVLLTAIYALFHGGRPMNSGAGVIYAGIAAAGSIAMSIVQNKKAKKVSSPILAVDAKHWMVYGLLSFGAGCAFLGPYYLGKSPYVCLQVYVNPALVIIFVLLMLRMPVSTIIEKGKELLFFAPEEALIK